MTVALLVDESGSMKGKKIVAARQVAILFREAFDSIRHLRLFIYGHTADVEDRLNTVIYRYCEPDKNNRFTLGTMSARNNSRDGIAIELVGTELLRLAKDHEIILIVISDGQPHAKAYKDDAAIAHTRDAVVSLEQRGVRVIQIAIDAVESERMFEHHIRMTNLSALPRDMTQLLGRLLRSAPN